MRKYIVPVTEFSVCDLIAVLCASTTPATTSINVNNTKADNLIGD